jgi:hypothetical protein
MRCAGNSTHANVITDAVPNTATNFNTHSTHRDARADGYPNSHIHPCTYTIAR